MKKFRLDLSEYKVEVQAHVRNEQTDQIEFVKKEEVYPIRQNLCDWLRLPIWKNGVEICDACDLAKQIKNCSGDELVLDEQELNLLQKALDKLISMEEDATRGIRPLGGEIHEECILRVFRAPEVK